MGVDFEFVHPFLYVLETLDWGEVENQENSDGAFVVGSGNGSKGFLSGCVPDLHFDFFVLDIEDLGPELDSKGRLVLAVEPSFDHAHEHAAFADAGVADHDELEEHVVIWHFDFRGYAIIKFIFFPNQGNRVICYLAIFSQK